MIFKANWEKTNERINLSKETILKILNTYYTDDNDIKNISIIQGGCANINVLVHLNIENNPVILRIYLRDKKSAYIEQKISTLLQTKKLSVPKFYHVGEAFGYTFAITEYLPGQSLRDLLLSDQKINISNIMFKIGKTLGNIANIKFPDSGFFDKNLEVRNILSAENLVSFCKSILADNKVKITIPQKQIDQIRNIFKIYKNLLPDGTERNLVHADFDPANILIVENNGQVEVSGILDWEFSFSGSTLWDIANMLRYAHHMPRDYKDSFLQGLISTGYTLPSSWQITINLLNIISLLDSLQRTTIEDRPNQVKDIQELISYILDDLSKIEVVPYKQNTLR